MPKSIFSLRTSVKCLNPKFNCLTLVCLMVALPGALLGQAPRYTPPPPPNKGVALEVRLRYLVPPNINFQGFGSIPFRDSYETSNNLILGTVRSVAYDDGFLGQDYVESTLVGGGQDGSELVPSANTAATSFFVYNNEDQVDPNDPTSLIFHRYASGNDPEEVFDGSSSGSLGWEINYTRFIDRGRKLGIQVGFSFNGFDSRFNESIDADLYVQEFRHQMADGALVPELPDPELDDDGNVISQPPYVGDAVVEDGAAVDLLQWLASEESEDLIADGATVDTKADLRSSVYSFRAGPTYTLNLGRSIGLNVGAGVSAMYFAGRFSAYEILQNPAGGENPSRGLLTTEEAEWQVGGYIDASAHYNFTDRVSLFSGLQVQSGSSYEQANEERRAEVDFNSQVYVHAGLGIRF